MLLRSRSGVDAAYALALFAFTAGLAFWADGQARQSGLRPQFYQERFAPAVLFACGAGFHNVDESRSPALTAFLQQTRGTLECGEIGRGLAAAPLDYFQRITLYLEWAVALTWRLLGVSWGAVSWLTALLAGLFAIAVYGVMRLGMRPLVAAIASTVVVTSPLHLMYVPQLRDYAKAPFLLTLVLLMGIAVKRALSPRQLLGLSGLGGVVAGVGFGFRTDLLLATVPFLATLVVFRAGPPSRRARIAQGAAASVVFVASFALAAAPVINRYARGGTLAHVILLGFGSTFGADLGVEARHYQLSMPYSDWYLETVVRSHASRLTGDTRVLPLNSKEYDRESSRYLMRVIATFPADVTVRAFSAVARILNAPFSAALARATSWVHSPFMTRIYNLRAGALERAGLLGWAASAVVVAGATVWSVRVAAFLAFILAFLTASAAIQFHARHFFYLEFVPWWAIGVLADRAVPVGRAIRRVVGEGEWRTRERLTRAGASVARSAALVVAVVLASSLLLGATRRYQQQSLTRLFERSLAAPRQPVRVTTLATGPDRVRVTVDLPELVLDPATWQSRSIAAAYLVVDVNPQRCDAWSFSARLRYEAGLNGTESTTDVTVPLVDPEIGSSIKVFLPVYAAWFASIGHQESLFSGIDLTSRDAACIASISKVGDLGAFPVLVTAVLGPGWRDASHYQTMIGLESRDDGTVWHEQFYPTLGTLDVPRTVFSQPMTSIWPDAVLLSTAAVRVPPSGMAVDGRPETPYAYLARSGVRAISRGTCAVAEGAITAGGLTFGLLRNGQWYQHVNIVDRGQFVAAGCVQDAGMYAIVLANDNPSGRATGARLTKIGWVMPAGTPDRD